MDTVFLSMASPAQIPPPHSLVLPNTQELKQEMIMESQNQ